MNEILTQEGDIGRLFIAEKKGVLMMTFWTRVKLFGMVRSLEFNCAPHIKWCRKLAQPKKIKPQKHCCWNKELQKCYAISNGKDQKK